MSKVLATSIFGVAAREDFLSDIPSVLFLFHIYFESVPESSG